ncbi:Ycf48-like protein [Pandoraea terrae]|uniref:Ycf48-like protein n=1 Tax=Pandoraea terrae TaxID=1537710 RepID=A0A5E4U9F9_9BURK|nr:YCF48-related protein [Pandoraea terrae]VVD96142.1 Ycf48-like protein [Pandoraea terrae]
MHEKVKAMRILERASRRRAWVVGAILALAAWPCVALDLDPLDPLAQPAAQSVRAASSVLIAVARAGNRIVAVGESGIIIASDDDGKSWSQAKVPVSVTLTSVYFATPQKGWAVGHSGVVLATSDGGKTWSKQLDGAQLAQLPKDAGAPATNAGDPILDVYFADETNGFVVGAFGLMLRTGDGGKTWERWEQHVPNSEGSHLYGIRAVGDALYIVGERGAIFVSTDRAEHFIAVKSPYEGSFFGLTGVPGNGVLVFGLRGHAFVSRDRGQSWSEIKTGSGNAWTGAAMLDDKRVVMVSQAGEIVRSEDGGRRFEAVPERRAPLSAVVGTAHGGMIAVGVRGAGLVELPVQKTGASGS